MTTGVRNTVLLCLALIAVVVGLFVYTTTRPDVMSKEELLERGTFVLPKPRDIAPFSLTAGDGSEFTNDDLEGRWSFVFFGYTSCPDICPITMSVLAEVERQLAESGEEELNTDFQGILVTVDPERDDAAAMKQYVSLFSDDFIGVTGTRQELAELASQLNVAFAKVPATGQQEYLVDHSGNIVVINPKGHYHAFIRLPHEAENIRLAYRSMAYAF